MGADVVAVRFESHDEMRARVNRRQSRHLHRVENSEHIQLSFLRKVGGVCKDGERDVHQAK